MSKALLFWILMLLLLLQGLAPYVKHGEKPPVQTAFPGLILFILLAILGWAEFGAAVT